MSKLIIITGHLAALKTTITKQLSHDLEILSLIKDDIKEVLGDSIGFQNREENLKLSKATFQLQKFLAKQALDLGQSVIIEGNFKQHEQKELSELLNRNYPILTIFLTGEALVLYDRYSKRHSLRHPVHTSTGLLSFETFKQVMNEYLIEDCIGETVYLDTSFYDKEMYIRIKDQVKTFLIK